MKKLIAAIVIASIGAAFADPYYVYDYKASIKRLDISAKYVSKTAAVTQKYSVKSDTIQGYVTVPVCKDCTGTLDSSIGIKDDGFAYLTMKGNSKNVNGKQYAVLKTPVKASIGVFGGEQYMDGKIVDTKKVNQAWMALDFPLTAEQFDTALLVAKKDVSAGVPLAFLGLSNLGENPDRIDVQNTGFGTAKVQTSSVFDFCDGQTSSSCLSVSSISGTLVGYPLYMAACYHKPMWDLCKVEPAGEIPDAVICGSWTLKFNKSLTNQYAENGETAILSKFKTTKFVEIDASGAFQNYTAPTSSEK